MVRRLILSLIAFLLAGVLAFAAGMVAEPETAVLPITAESPCPAVGCASGECHGFDNVPEPDGVHEMDCPEASCSSAECHAWDTLLEGYRQADDASLNLWVLAPVALVLGLVLMVQVLSKSPKAAAGTKRGAVEDGSAGSDTEGEGE